MPNEQRNALDTQVLSVAGHRPTHATEGASQRCSTESGQMGCTHKLLNTLMRIDHTEGG